MVGEFLNEALVPKDIGYITWHLDPDSLGTFKSFVNVGIWDDEKAFHEQIGQYFNDDMPVKDFEMYRRRRIALRPECWRMGDAKLPVQDSGGVL